MADGQTSRAERNGDAPLSSTQQKKPAGQAGLEMESLIKDGNWKVLQEKLRDADARYLAKYRVSFVEADNDVTLLHFAALHACPKNIIRVLAKKCPDLLTTRRNKQLPGQTVLHVLVGMKRVEVVKYLFTLLTSLSAATCSKKDPKGKNRDVTPANGKGQAAKRPPTPREFLAITMEESEVKAFTNTVMLGGLPLSIAALTFNKDMVDLLLEYDAPLHEQNYRKDTVFHSLVRFSSLVPGCQDQTLTMMRYLHSRILRGAKDPRSLWMAKNWEKMTALQLSAQLGQSKLFDYILGLPDVYRVLDNSHVLYNHLCYDITELDPAAMALVEKQRTEHKNRISDGTEGSLTLPRARRDEKSRPLGSRSVVELLDDHKQDDSEGFTNILQNCIVNYVVTDRWEKWKWIFRGWTVLHLFFMVWLTFYVEHRARIITSVSLGSYENTFVVVTAFLLSIGVSIVLIPSVFLLGRSLRENYRTKTVAQIIRDFTNRRHFYTFVLCIFFFLLFADSVLFLRCWYMKVDCSAERNHPMTALVLITGWSFTSFFLRPYKDFSFFTVMLIEVLFRDILRFLFIFLPSLVAFSMAMFTIFVNTEAEGFTSFWSTMLTMVKLTMGLTEVESLSSAPDDLQWLATVLYVCFIVLAYCLMFNALIALMSNTCSFVSQNRETQCKKERLSVVLFLQSVFPFCFLPQTRHTVGNKTSIDMEDHQKHSKRRDRYFLTITELRKDMHWDDYQTEPETRQTGKDDKKKKPGKMLPGTQPPVDSERNNEPTPSDSQVGPNSQQDLDIQTTHEEWKERMGSSLDGVNPDVTAIPQAEASSQSSPTEVETEMVKTSGDTVCSVKGHRGHTSGDTACPDVEGEREDDFKRYKYSISLK